MRFDTIVVPRGAEARAVIDGWPVPRPELVCVPAGASAANALTSGEPARTALVLGLCGALDPALRLGDSVVYARIIAGAAVIELDAELAAMCAVACDCASRDAAAVPRVVGDRASKAALRATTGAAVIDMEAAAIGRALHARGTRVAMVRVVSDTAAGELPDLSAAYDASGALRPLALAAAFARTPVRGARFIIDVLRALQALQTVAARLSVSLVE